MEGYHRVREADLHVGDVVIMERMHFDYNRGFPVESEYFRAVVGEHRTVSGMRFHLKAQPDVQWPSIPPWQMGWIYAQNGGVNQMWMKDEG